MHLFINNRIKNNNKWHKQFSIIFKGYQGRLFFTVFNIVIGGLKTSRGQILMDIVLHLPINWYGD